MAAVALRMPTSYVPIEEDEMEYVEGGAYINNGVINTVISLIGGVALPKILATKVTAKAAGMTLGAVFAEKGKQFVSWLTAGGVAGFIAKVLITLAVASVGVAFGIAFFKGTGISVTFSGGISFC